MSSDSSWVRASSSSCHAYRDSFRCTEQEVESLTVTVTVTVTVRDAARMSCNVLCVCVLYRAWLAGPARYDLLGFKTWLVNKHYPIEVEYLPCSDARRHPQDELRCRSRYLLTRAPARCTCTFALPLLAYT